MNDEKQRDDEAAAAAQPQEPEDEGKPGAALADEAPAADAEQPTEEAADEPVDEAPEEEVESAADADAEAAAETDEVDEAVEAPAASQPARRRASQRDQAPEGIPALFGRKLGMLQVFDESGAVQNVTALELGPCVVTMVRTPQRDGYSAVQLGWGQSRNLSKPAAGHLAPSAGEFRHLREVRVEDSASFGVGQQVTASIFQPGERVDVTSTSKGRGFAGGVKRHGFHGGPKTHGQSDRHRAPGSIGAGTTPGHVLKGQKMAGHMGARQVTVRSLVVVKSDDEKNLLLVRGSVPGPINGLVRVKRTTRAVAK